MITYCVAKQPVSTQLTVFVYVEFIFSCNIMLFKYFYYSLVYKAKLTLCFIYFRHCSHKSIIRLIVHHMNVTKLHGKRLQVSRARELAHSSSRWPVFS